MVHPKHLTITDFQYDLPDNRIAVFPLAERDQSKLLFFNGQTIADHSFTDISEVLPQNSMLVFNDTKVVQARLLFKTATGATVEIFCLEPLKPATEIQLAMQQTGSCVWRCLVGNAKKWKTETLLLELNLNGYSGTLQASKGAALEGSFEITFTWEPSGKTFAEILAAAGNIPLPPYFKRPATEADQTRYQTVYATAEGAVAAPTAGLHFTPEVLENLKRKNFGVAYLTLHVGAGTFRPVKAETMAGHDMHAEQIVLSENIIAQLLSHLPNPVIPVGTTSMRTLESLYWLGCMTLEKPDLEPANLNVTQWQAYENPKNYSVEAALKSLLNYIRNQGKAAVTASTGILIAPGYAFKICTGLVTNFHQPGSTLLLLVAALTGSSWKTIYNHALENNYRFLSYGDSSLLLPKQ